MGTPPYSPRLPQGTLCACPHGIFALHSLANNSDEYCEFPSNMVWDTAQPLSQLPVTSVVFLAQITTCPHSHPLVPAAMMIEVSRGMEKVVQFDIPSEGNTPAEKPDICLRTTQEHAPAQAQPIQTIKVLTCIKQGTQTE